MNADNHNGFQTSGYIDKKGTPSGESAHFNELPPGQHIDKQKVADIRDLPMKRITPQGYPDDGGFGNG